LLFEKARLLGLTKNDSGFTQVVRRDLHFDFVAWNDPNEILSHFSADMRQNPLAIGQRNPKHSVWKHLGYNPFSN